MHSAISHLIYVEQELEAIPEARSHELRAAGLRHALYSLLGLGPRDSLTDVDLRDQPHSPTVDTIIRELGDGTVHDPSDPMAPLLGDGGCDPTDITRYPTNRLSGYEYHEG